MKTSFENNPSQNHLLITTLIVVAVIVALIVGIHYISMPRVPGTCYGSDENGYCVLYNGTIVHDIADTSSEGYKQVLYDSQHGGK